MIVERTDPYIQDAADTERIQTDVLPQINLPQRRHDPMWQVTDVAQLANNTQFTMPVLDTIPEYWMVVFAAGGAGQVTIYQEGDAVGPPLRLTLGKGIVFPCRDGSLTVRNGSGNAADITIVAVSGFYTALM